MLTSDWLGALMIGFLGSAHCVGMCGGIASVMNLNSVVAKYQGTTTILYNCGRLLSYMFAGAIIGGAVSSSTSYMTTSYAAFHWLRLLSALVMIALALYIGKWWQGLLYVEKMGQYLWKYIHPITLKFLPLPSIFHALPLGFLWGWLPCGLVYSTLTWSALSGSALNGSIIMLAFGIGTLPSMLFVSFGSNYVSQLKNSIWFRQVGAILLLMYSGYILRETLNLLL